MQKSNNARYHSTCKFDIRYVCAVQTLAREIGFVDHGGPWYLQGQGFTVKAVTYWPVARFGIR